MDTLSEQAPHTCSRIGNGRRNISHLSKELARAFLSHQGIKNALAQAPEVCTTAGFGQWRDDLPLAPEVGYVVFSASFGLCCSSLKWWPILSSTADQRRRFSLTSHKHCVSKLWNSALIAQQPCCGREDNQCKNIFLVAVQPLASVILLFGWTERYWFSAEMMYSAHFGQLSLNDHVCMCSLYFHVKLEVLWI